MALSLFYFGREEEDDRKKVVLFRRLDPPWRRRWLWCGLSQRDGGCGLNDAIPIKFDDGEGNLLLGKMGERGAKEAESEAEAKHSALYPPIFDPDFLLFLRLLFSSPLQYPLGDLTCVCVCGYPSISSSSPIRRRRPLLLLFFLCVTGRGIIR